jgi:MFS family permease
MSALLINMEVSIVSTSLVTITSEFHGFKSASWIVTSYLSTYTGFLIIWANLSDVFGRKLTFAAANVIFLAFSAGCGAAQSMSQL